MTHASYLDRLRHLSRPARLYLLHAAFLTSSLAISGLFFNLAVDALGYPRTFLGLLNTISIGVAALLSLPLWWLATRVGLRRALLASAALNAASALLFALGATSQERLTETALLSLTLVELFSRFWPASVPLLVYSALTGVAAVLFQVSAPPFMMRHSDAESRDHLFTANAAINIGLAGIGSLVAGGLPGLFGRLLGFGAESAEAYRVTFLVTAGGLLLSLIPLLLIADQESRIEDRGSKIEALDPRSSILDPRSSLPTSKLKNLKSRLPDFWQRIIERPGPLLRLLLPPLLISFGAALLIPYLNLFFKQRFGIPDTTLGVIFAALNISIGIAALIGPTISTRIGKIRTVALTQALSIPFLIVLGFALALPLVILAALVRAALFNMASPLYDAFAMERTEEAARPTVIGLVNGAYSAGYLIAPAISTWVQARYGFGPLFVATAICYSLAALANYWFFVRGEKRKT